MGLSSLRKPLKQTEKKQGDNHRWFELVAKEKKALRDESDLEIQNLELSLHEANAKTEKERGDNHRWFELVAKEKKALRYETNLEIHNHELSLRKANSKVKVEHHLKKEAIGVSYITLYV
ncbi:hypothetical protein KIW84_035150 [Lathyrus oleraceus]|uniref:Uncharacterized protein n=1 Tax=Pisum sativum TaxID=3888 RepID=A0A9D4Y4U2_PEA|nr:hypothetical protein KIW84_035150 [Pisum sativum]